MVLLYVIHNQRIISQRMQKWLSKISFFQKWFFLSYINCTALLQHRPFESLAVHNRATSTNFTIKVLWYMLYAWNSTSEMNFGYLLQIYHLSTLKEVPLHCIMLNTSKCLEGSCFFHVAMFLPWSISCILYWNFWFAWYNSL